MSAGKPQLVLASASPRRRELLSTLVPEFRVQPADVDESPLVDESPDDHVMRLARLKARAVIGRFPGARVLGSDTVVVIDGTILGKPGDADDARRMLGRLSGRDHQVMSAVALAGQEGETVALNVTRVFFESFPKDWIDAYVESGEPMDKAGAYAVQGGAAAWIPRLEGSYSGVMGLPLFETAGLLRQAGVL